MPAAPARVCTSPGCHTLVHGGESRCAKHPYPKWERSPGREGSTTERGYGHEWKKLREKVLMRDGWLCQVSLARGQYVPASEVDHVIGKAAWLALHGSLHGVDDPSNLQAISRYEHRLKTEREANADRARNTR